MYSLVSMDKLYLLEAPLLSLARELAEYCTGRSLGATIPNSDSFVISESSSQLDCALSTFSLISARNALSSMALRGWQASMLVRSYAVSQQGTDASFGT